MERILFSIFFSLVFISANAGDDKFVKGKLVDDHQEPVPFTSVFLVNASDSLMYKAALTDSIGNFEIPVADTGSYLLVISADGYQKFTSEIIVVDHNFAGKTFDEIKLVTQASTLNEVEITERKKFIEMQAGKIVVTPDNSPIAAGGTAMDVLKRSPGVMVDNDQNISLKGKQNVLVMIDDKPTYMTRDQVMNMLKNMPASQVASIEIINNPSAKFDAAGNAGIINIKLKKLKKIGYNGSLSLGGGYGWYAKYNAGLNLNMRTKKFNVFGSYNFNNGTHGNKNYLNRHVGDDEYAMEFDQFFEDKSTNTYHAFKAGIDFFLTEKTTVGFLFKGTVNPGESGIENFSSISGYNNLGFDSLKADNVTIQDFNNFIGNINLTHTFDSIGTKLTFDVDYSTYNSDESGRFVTHYYENDGEVNAPTDLRNKNFSQVDIVAGKIDLYAPLKKNWVLETGLKSSYVTIDNGINFELLENGTYVPDSSRNNDFTYKENINAAYSSLSRQFKKGSLNVGLRVEHTNNTGISVTLDSTVTRQYVSVFPSFSYSWDVDSTNNLTFSYSRRIDRPTYQHLNPFLYYADQYTFMKGNPFLKPQFTEGFSITHGFMQFLFTSIGADITTNYIGEIISQDTATKISFMTNWNFKRFNNYYASINTGFPIKNYMMQLSMTGFYNQFDAQYENNPSFSNSQFTYNLWMSHAYTFKKINTSIELSGFYNSKAIYGVFKMSPMYMAQVGIRKTFPRQNINLNVSVNDIFNTMRNSIIVNDNGMDMTFRNKWESRKVMVNLTWNFGKGDKRQNKRKTATEEEQERVKKESNF